MLVQERGVLDRTWLHRWWNLDTLFQGMVLNWGRICPPTPREIWQCLIVTNGATGIQWIEVKDAAKNPTVQRTSEGQSCQG